MNNPTCDKMIIAVLQNDDYHEVIQDLNDHGFYVTVLSSSGGFLKKPNATIMIGLNHEDLDRALALLKQYGKRTEMDYRLATTTAGLPVTPIAATAMPVPFRCGGVVIFVLDVAQFERY